MACGKYNRCDKIQFEKIGIIKTLNSLFLKGGMICLVGNVETAAIRLRRMLLRIHAHHARRNVNFWIILVTPPIVRPRGWTQESGKKGSRFSQRSDGVVLLEHREINH
jgi:hypothetical protein